MSQSKARAGVHINIIYILDITEKSISNRNMLVYGSIKFSKVSTKEGSIHAETESTSLGLQLLLLVCGRSDSFLNEDIYFKTTNRFSLPFLFYHRDNR